MSDFQDVAAVLKQRGLDFIGLAFDAKVGNMVMHTALPEMSRYSIPRQLQDFQPFAGAQGEGDVRNLMAMKKGGWIYYAFDFRHDSFEEDPVVDADPGPYGVVAADITVDLPLLTIKPQDAVSRLEGHFGAHGMQLESNEFNERFCLSCTEKERVSDLLNPTAIQVLLNAPAMTWQMGGRHVVLFQNGELTVEFAAVAMDALMSFASSIPGFVQEDHFASPPAV